MKRCVKTKCELARLIGVSRPALYRIMDRNRDTSPGLTELGMYDIEEWRKFVHTHFASWTKRVFPQ